MSKAYYGILLSLFVIAACNKSNDGPDKPTMGTKSVVQRFLVENYTAHRAVNSPALTFHIDSLKGFYGDQMTVVSVHAESFAAPSAEFPADYRTPSGDELIAFWQALSIPSAMLNRAEFPGNHWLYSNSLDTAVASASQQLSGAELQISAQVSGGNLNCDIEVLYQYRYEGQYAVVLWILEDSLVSPQLTPAGVDSTYTHNNVLRASITDTSGDTLSIGTVNLNSPYQKAYTTVWNADWNEQNCSVVAFLYDLDTYELIQVEEITL